MESKNSPTYELVEEGDISIVKYTDQETVNIDNVKEYFKNNPNVKCVYGDYLDKFGQRKYQSTFDIRFVNNSEYPVLFTKGIPMEENPFLMVSGKNDILQFILRHTFIHHIPTVVSHTK